MSSYLAFRKVIIPGKIEGYYKRGRYLYFVGLQLTHQLTINRSHLPVVFNSASTSKPLSKFSLLDTISTGGRFVYLSWLFGPLLVGGLPLYLLGILSESSLFSWLRWCLSRAGGTFIKLGQWAATRPDVLPPALCLELTKLHSNAPFHPVSWSLNVIKGAFGSDSLISKVDSYPIGSGTIAQVHRAQLKGKKER